MNLRTSPWAIVAVAAAAAAAPAAAAGLLTHFQIVVGQPTAGPSGGALVEVQPGEVKLADVDADHPAEALFRITAKLQDSYRLADLRYGESTRLVMTPGVVEELSLLPGAVTIRATLVAVHEGSAVYRIRLEEGTRLLAEPTLSVRSGQYAVVGGRDGETAPYFFLLIRPATEKDEAEERFWANRTRPKLDTKVLPTYPENARKTKTQGVVVLRVSIATDGRVTDVKVLRSPSDELGAAAAEAIRQWAYTPARDEKGVPFAVDIDVVTTFRLQ